MKHESKHTIKLLGVRISADLNWKHHIYEMSKKLHSCYYLIKKIVEVSGVETGVILYYSNFFSIINYSIMLWGGSPHALRIFTLQKKLIRTLANLKPQEHCKPSFRDLKILTVPSLYVYNSVVYVRENITAFKQRSEIHNYGTRAHNSLEIPYHRLNATQQSINYQAVKLYNKLPLLYKTMPLNKFKHEVKIYLQSQAYYSIDEFMETG